MAPRSTGGVGGSPSPESPAPDLASQRSDLDTNIGAIGACRCGGAGFRGRKRIQPRNPTPPHRQAPIAPLLPQIRAL